MKKTLLLCVFSFILSYAFSQDVEYATKCVEKLSSKSFHGRGYVKNGDGKAAKFIASEFKKNNLLNFDTDFYQDYNFPINTFPSKINLEIEGESLEVASDYVISCSNKSTSGIFHLVYAPDSINNDSLFLEFLDRTKLKSNDVLVVNFNTRMLYGKSIEGVKGIILKTDKIWWHVSGSKYLSNTFWLKVKKEFFEAKPKSIELSFSNEFKTAHKTQNVIGYVKGQKYPDKFIVVTAHYDHLGMMGNKAYFPGANDNASGTAMIMDMARHYSKPENRTDYSIAFMAFSGEEAGLFGANNYVDNPYFPLDDIELLINLDMVGSGSNGITVVNSGIYEGLLKKMRDINENNMYLPQIKKRGESCNSDHCPFYKKGVKAIFIYTMGEELQEYHTIYDNANEFPFTKYNELFGLLNELIIKY